MMYLPFNGENYETRLFELLPLYWSSCFINAPAGFYKSFTGGWKKKNLFFRIIWPINFSTYAARITIIVYREFISRR